MEILTAEDKAAIREVEAEYLQRAEYTAVDNGQQALDAFAQRGADLPSLTSTCRWSMGWRYVETYS